MVWNRLLWCAALIILASLSSPLITVAAQQTGEIIVRVVGLASNKGEVRFGLYNTAESFQQRVGHAMRSGTCPIQEYQCEFTITEVPYGIYAIMVGHDENLNGKIDWISGERAGVSNYTGKLRWFPNFDKAKFAHTTERTFVEIRIY
jgi:uncharacterized protein (DUF2141 family)